MDEPVKGLHREAIATLKAIETEFPVAQWCVRGIHVWPIIRTAFTAEMLLADQVKSERSHRRRLTNGIKTAVEGLWNRSSPIPKSADVLFFGSPVHRQKLRDGWYDRLFDPIADILESHGHTSFHLEYQKGELRHRAPTYRPCQHIRNEVLAGLPRAALGVLRGPKPNLSRYDSLADWLIQRDVDLVPLSTAWLLLRVRAIESVSRYFEHLMMELRPRVVMCACYYGLVGMAMSLAARRLGIISVDVQHGVTELNPAYEGWTKFPAEGYELLPKRFWVWGEDHRLPVAAWPTEANNPHVPFVGGHPWFAALHGQVASGARAASKVSLLPGQSTNVLVTLSWSTGLSKQLKQILRSAPEDWWWWVRLHPRMERSRGKIRRWCKKHLGARADVDRATDFPLFELIRNSDVHLTHNSTVVQEAAALGKASVLIDPRGVEVYAQEVESGWALYEPKLVRVIDALRDQCTAPKTLKPIHRYPSWEFMTKVVLDLVGNTEARRSHRITEAT